MAHDNYDNFYTWNGGTLVLDPGIFSWDEPHIELCNEEPIQASALNRVLDPYEQRFCAKPMRFMSSRGGPMSNNVAARCDTITPGRSYCCSPYVMPNDWRVDYLPLGDDIDALIEQATQDAGTVIQDVGVVVQNQGPAVEKGVAQVLREAIVRSPLLSVSIGVLSGMVLAKFFDGRR